MRRPDPLFFVLLAFAALAAAPLTAPGYFSQAHDARHTIYFMQMFDAALRDGALYPRWAPDMTFGYGYPLWLLIAPLPYFAAEVFHLLGLDFVAAVKAVDALGLLLSGAGMYLWVRRVFGREAGLVASIAYIYIPYHIVDLYVRAAFGEFLSFALAPFAFWAAHLLATTRRPVYVPLLALAYSGLVLTHVQMALVLSPVLGLYIVLLWLAGGKERKPSWRGRETLTRLALPACGILWGVALAAIFLVPVLAEQRYLTNDPLIGGFFDFRQHFVSLAQLLSPYWGYGYAGINGGDQFSLQLGALALVLSIVALFGLRTEPRPERAHLALFGLVTVSAVLLMLPVATPFWNRLAPFVAYVQFPWRLLTITALSLAVLSGAAVRVLRPVERLPGALVFSLLLVLALYPDSQPQYTQAMFNTNTLMDFQVNDRELLGDTIWLQGPRPSDSPLVAQYRAGAITEKAIVVEGQGQVTLIAHRSQSDQVQVTADGPARIMFYTHYFPGWTGTVNGAPAKELEPYGDQGLISVRVPAGVSTVRVQFGDTPPRLVGAAISLLALAGAGLWIALLRKSGPDGF